MANQERLTYRSEIPYQSGRIGAAAVYCSDGRLGEHFDDFLHNVLCMPRYDRLALPGGAACLAGYFAAYREEDAAVAQLEFLVSVHGLKRVVLIAHQDCAFYTHRLEVSPLGLAERQYQDLETALRRVREIGPALQVEAWFASRRDGSVAFEHVGA